jgi:S-adenosylmethionine:tRNA ribosyltransferase-isomerase
LIFDRPRALQATGPPEYRGLERDEVRLLVSTDQEHEHARFRDLPRFLAPGTLLVVNTSATLPASLPAQHPCFESLVANVSTDYGKGLYLIELRKSAAEPGPLPLEVGDVLEIAGLPARLVAPHPGLPRLWFVHVETDLRRAMERAGAPIRYGYLEEPYPPLAVYQTLFACEPGSAEMPSAGRPFTRLVVDALRARGIALADVILHTGVSSHELEADEVEKQVLYAEPFEVPQRTADAVTAARREGRPVVAVGTTVVRALESAWNGERVRATAGFTRLLIHPGRPVKTVDGLITGLHDPLANHLALLYSIAPKDLVRAGYEEAVREGYLWHEFGDSHLLLAERPPHH